jgi:hypothetical protein
MPITLGGRTYSDDEVRQFYTNGGNEAAFAQQNGLSDAEAQSAMSQARSITSSPASPAPVSNSFTGVNSVDYNKGVFSPTENRWIPNAEIQNFFAANPNMSATEMNRLAGNLGMNPYSINYAAHVGTGSKGPRDPAYAQLVHELQASQWRGDSGYGADFDAAHRAGTNPLTAGAGNIQYQMPNGSYHSVRVHNGRPDQTYQQVLGSLGSLVGGSQSAGIINSAAGQLSQGDQSPPTVVADGGQYLPDGTWSDLVNGKHTGTVSPGTYAQSKIGSF